MPCRLVVSSSVLERPQEVGIPLLPFLPFVDEMEFNRIVEGLQGANVVVYQRSNIIEP